jgi:hypothetical protein
MRSGRERADKSLLKQDWNEPSIEIAYATFAQNAHETGD